MKRACIAIALALLASAQIAPPRIGMARDRSGSVRSIYGVAGAFVIGDVMQESVLSCGFGRNGGYVKTRDAILTVRDGAVVDQTPAPEGGAVFAIDSAGEIDAIYFIDAHELWHMRGSRFETQPGARTFLPPLRVENGDVVLPSGGRVRLAEPASDAEWASDKYAVARTEAAVYAVRLADGAFWQLPEVAR